MIGVSRVRTGALVAVVLATATATATASGLLCAGEALVIKAKRVYPVSSAPIGPVVILVRDGTIAAIENELEPPEGAAVLSAEVVIPGIIDALSGVGLRQPIDEQSQEVTPRMRVSDCFDPTDASLLEARAGGVTVAHVSPGKRNVIGGLSALVTTYGGPTRAGMLLKDETALCAVLGPEAARGNTSFGWGPPRNIFFRRPTTRMAVIQMFRDVLGYARDLRGKDVPEDVGAEKADLAVVGRVLDGSLPLRVYTGRVIDIRLLLREAKTFGFTPVIEDGWEAYKEAKTLSSRSIPVVLTPWSAGLVLNDRGGDVRINNAALLAKNGVRIALATAGVSVDPLFIGAMAVRTGLSEEQALRALTLTPAELLGISAERGSIEKGKVADLVILSGSPFSATTRVIKVIGSGKVVFPQEGGGRG